MIMYRYQFSRLIKRYWVVAAVFPVLAFAVRFIVIKAYDNDKTRVKLDPKALSYLSEMIAESREMSRAEQFAFICDYEIQAFAQNDRAAAEAANYYHSALDNCLKLDGVTEYSNSGEGIVSADIPPDLIENEKLYANMGKADIAYTDPYMLFLKLRTFALTDIFAVILVGLFVCASCENGLHKQIHIMKNRKLFLRSREITLTALLFIAYTFGFIADIILSGAHKTVGLFGATVQSDLNFLYSPIRLTFSGLTIWLYATGLMKLLITYSLLIICARSLCSVRKYLITAVSALTVFSAAAVYIPEVSPYLFCAVSDKMTELMYISYIKALDGSECVSVLLFCMALLGGLCAWRWCGYRTE